MTANQHEDYQELQNRQDLQQIVPLIRDQSSVLDLGCGTGDLLKYLRDHKNVDPRGVEISEEGIKECIRNGIPVFQSDLDKGLKDYNKNRFDYVILSQTLQQVRKPLLVIKEMLRVGKKGIVSIPNFGFWKIRLNLLFTGRMPKSKQLPYEWYDTPNIHLATIRDFYDLCERNNIEIEKSVFLSSTMSQKGVLANISPNIFASLGIFLIREK